MPFSSRHIGPSDDEVAGMLAQVGAASLEDLVRKVVPPAILSAEPLDLPPGRPEAGVLAWMRELAQGNRVLRSYIGQGYYGTHTPPVIQRNILENPAWYTAYTPYQPEISQGRLQALLVFQTMVCSLTGLDIANASLLDEATAAAEAMTLARRSSSAASNVFFVSEGCHPQTLEVVRTRAAALGIEVVAGDETDHVPACFGVLLQYPCSTGEVRRYGAIAEQVRAAGGVVACATDLLALAVLRPPGEWGADIAIGSAQRFGVPMGFGGPHAAFMACRDGLQRNLPGRLVGVSRDAAGKPALRLALQTREQHIRREKATSNICTSQVLLAVMAAMYAVWHGPQGIARIARRVHAQACRLRQGLAGLGVEAVHEVFFDTLLLRTGAHTDAVLNAAREAGINLRRLDPRHVALSLDETVTRDDLHALLRVFAQGCGAACEGEMPDDAQADDACAIPQDLARRSPILAHPVFRSVHSETDMLRWLRRLSDQDLALDRTMIPLGSCTMKLNATAEMMPITWPRFAALHPFAPAAQSAGYRELEAWLARALCEITGYEAISFQPNSGAQGEYAGLMAIRAYHAARGEPGRDLCLIPASAHGTNPASAQLAGMRVAVVACDRDGNIDVQDLRARVAAAGPALAALMVTYPSTHGVFEDAISEICDIVHQGGGQVYLDGANMNALVGLVRPGRIGADVSHLNLHKTFCIPHGGGGPGAGPVAVKAHLAPYLPGAVGEDGRLPPGARCGPVSAAPLGSAGILPIPAAYIALMGGEGLRRATQVAILNANYVARRLSAHYPVLYAGRGGYVAHECILDLRPIKQRCGIDAEDVAKRLIDYGFHAPTMSFPVPGTLMVEPTESEGRAELDRFIEAMIAIRAEIAEIESGAQDASDNLLRNAPHTAGMLLAEAWRHGYARERAAYPLPWLREHKYWPPVARVDNLYGDRNLVCACPLEDGAAAPGK
nr:aminomethyl-transferring glycine dehydrogenase [Pigmentiphaga humi]